MVHSNNETSGFVSKAKKQAKNFLKIAKNLGGSIPVDNLSQAQEVIAKINGFPNWFSLQEVETLKLTAKKLPVIKVLKNFDKESDINLFKENGNSNQFLIGSDPGYASDVWINDLLTEYYFNTPSQQTIKTLYFSIGDNKAFNYVSDYKGDDFAKQLRVGVENVNLLSFPLGEFSYPEKLKHSIALVLSKYAKQKLLKTAILDEKDTYEYFVAALNDFSRNEKYIKMYVPGFNLRLDDFVEKNHLKNKSWKEIYHILAKENISELAYVAHQLAAPTLIDFDEFNFYYKKNNSTDCFGSVEIEFLDFAVSELSLYVNEFFLPSRKNFAHLKILKVSFEEYLLNKNILNEVADRNDRMLKSFVVNAMGVVMARDYLHLEEFCTNSSKDQAIFINLTQDYLNFDEYFLFDEFKDLKKLTSLSFSSSYTPVFQNLSKKVDFVSLNFSRYLACAMNEAEFKEMLTFSISEEILFMEKQVKDKYKEDVAYVKFSYVLLSKDSEVLVSFKKNKNLEAILMYEREFYRKRFL